MEKRGVAVLERRFRARDKAARQVERILAKVYARGVDSVLVDFFQTVHEFFADFCQIRYEFTYSELTREIKKRKVFEGFLQDKVLEFINSLQEKEYSNADFSREELIRYARDFKTIVSMSSTAKTADEKLRPKHTWLLGTMRVWLHGIKRALAKKEASQIVALLGAAEEGIRDKNLERSQRIYNQIDSIYARLSSEEKRAVYPQMKALYGRIEGMHANIILKRLEERQRVFHSRLESGDTAGAKRAYDEIDKLYEELPGQSRKRFYPEIRSMHRKLQDQLCRNEVVEIKRLLTEVLKNLGSEEKSVAQWNYRKAERSYEELPAKVKKGIYGEMKRVYERLTQGAGAKARSS
jgi:hypothetical protein